MASQTEWHISACNRLRGQRCTHPCRTPRSEAPLILSLSHASSLAGDAAQVEAQYLPILLALGAMILVIAWLPFVLRKLPLSLPIVCDAIGLILFSFPPFSAWAPHPEKTPKLVERATEMIGEGAPHRFARGVDQAGDCEFVAVGHGETPQSRSGAPSGKKWR